MAKKTSGRKSSRAGSKAQAIRDEFASQGPSARPRDIIAALKAKGITVSSAQVSNLKASKGKRGPGRKSAGRHSGNGMISLATLVEVKKLADRLGGVENARHALDALAQLA